MSIPASKIHFCVHQGYKVLASLVLTRPPLVFVEPPALKDFREFQAVLEQRTDTAPPVDEHQLVYMRLPTHFLASREDRDKRRKADVVSPEAAISSRLGSLAVVPSNRKKGKKHNEVSASGLADVNRLPEDYLHLLVKYRGTQFWTFPFAHRKREVSMKRTLEELAADQLGLSEANFHVINYVPSYVRKIPGDPSKATPVHGAKVFHYRAWPLPGAVVKLKADGQVADLAWMSRSELKDALSPAAWLAAHEVLPLDENFVLNETRYASNS